MKKNRFNQLMLCFALSLPGTLSSCTETKAPQPYGATPSEYQMEWQKMEYYMFIHFGPNTFTDVEWGDGKENPKVFNPTNLDCRQWASIAKDAGMKAIIITAKHHDGFCLWPSNYSTHTVRESAWKDGKGDLLKELSEACKEYGLKFGVYLSPWDQNHPAYGTPEYNQIFANTLTEVLTGYGHVFEQWFDGANGEGASGKKQVYDWDLFHNTVYKHQPHAIIFSDIGPGCRWMGNERGVAGKTNWSTLNTAGFGPGHDAPTQDTLNMGNVNGADWVPAETDVSIRPGWFYSPKTDNKVKTIDHLVDIYYTSIGRNSNLLLNVPPNREGRIHPNDSARLMELRKAIDESFSNNLIKGATLQAGNTRGNASQYTVSNLLNGNYDSYWATDDETRKTYIEINLKKPEVFNRFLIQEYIPLGQRVARFSIEKWNEATSQWEAIQEATTIGYKRILRFPEVTAQKLRLSIHESLACPVLNNMEIYYAPDSFGPSQQASNISGLEPTDLQITTNTTSNTMLMIDGNDKTTVSIKNMAPIVFELKQPTTLKGFYYTPSDDNTATHVTRYNLHFSEDGKKWTTVKKNSIFNNIKNNPIKQEVNFDKPLKAKFIKFEPVETTTGNKTYIVAELGAY